MELSSVVAMVTGGASGLGRATAARLAKAGARVTLLDLDSSPGEATASELGEHVQFVATDVRAKKT